MVNNECTKRWTVQGWGQANQQNLILIPSQKAKKVVAVFSSHDKVEKAPWPHLMTFLNKQATSASASGAHQSHWGYIICCQVHWFCDLLEQNVCISRASSLEQRDFLQQASYCWDNRKILQLLYRIWDFLVQIPAEFLQVCMDPEVCVCMWKEWDLLAYGNVY